MTRTRSQRTLTRLMAQTWTQTWAWKTDQRPRPPPSPVESALAALLGRVIREAEEECDLQVLLGRLGRDGGVVDARAEEAGGASVRLVVEMRVGADDAHGARRLAELIGRELDDDRVLDEGKVLRVLVHVEARRLERVGGPAAARVRRRARRPASTRPAATR